jgi:signal transduction histidine kinase/CheY-like chemotaxis protein
MPRRLQKLLRRPWIGVALSVLGIVALAWAVVAEAGRASVERERAAYWELHTVRVQVQTQLVLAAIEAAESGQRGYLLTGEDRYLASYNEGAEAARTHMGELRGLTNDNADQRERLTEAERLMRIRLAGLEEILEIAESGRRGVAIARVRGGYGIHIMEDLNEELDLIWRAETALLAERREASQRAIADQRRAGVLVIALAGVLVIAVLAFALTSVRAERAARANAYEAEVARRVGAELEARVREAVEAQRRTEEALRRSQKMEAIGQLAGGIAHDFNNMLAVILGSLELAQRRLASGGDDVERFLTNAIDGGRRAAALTQRVLAFSRQQPLAPKPLDVNALVSGMLELLSRTLGAPIRLETTLASEWLIHADANELESVILNLAVNARDAMPEGGVLTIATGAAVLDEAYAAANESVTAGEYVFVAVSDTGAGMTPEVIARAFEPFFTTKGPGQGTGLGLSQAFGFAKQSGGHIQIDSEPGEGARVTLYLPRWTGALPSEQGADPVAEAPRGDIEDIILVVDDDERVRLVTVETLRELGYTVRHVSGADEALAAISEGARISLLFTDLAMAGMSGRHLAAAAVKLQPGLKVLYTTGYAKDALAAGAEDSAAAIIMKPFSMSQLARKVREVLDR